MAIFQSRRVVSFFVFILLVCGTNVLAQSKCLSDTEIKKIVDGINNPKTTVFNENLRQQLRTLKLETTQIYEEMARFRAASKPLEERLRLQKERNSTNLCQILREYGWTSFALVGVEGSEIAATFFLDSLSAESQQQLFPVMEAAFKAGEIPKSNWARMVDQTLVHAGRTQIFGTAVGVSKDLLLLYPIENEAIVDGLRREYELPPLAEQIRRFERNYQAVMIKPAISAKSLSATSPKANAAAPKIAKTDDDEVLQIETNLVSLNATVLADKTGAELPPLTKNDFVILENGVEQSIEYFAQTQVPFDITLLIDISGSTASKNKLIRKTTRSFIKAARAVDRLSITTFDEEIMVISPLTQNREQLLASVEKIKNGGGSKVWDALGWSLDQIKELENTDSSATEVRRRAVVFITDGADNGFVNDRDASTLIFTDLLEKARQNQALIIPIHLDTRADYGLTEKLYQGTRRALNLLADETGGLFYEARKVDDLTNVYEQVINDLSKVYSLGYSPANVARDNLWRTVKINLKNHPALRVRSRKGYYAR